MQNAAAQTTLNFPYTVGVTKVASVQVKRGENRFGGVMKLLGKFRTKVCYYYAAGCALGSRVSWQYTDIGAAGYKNGGVVTAVGGLDCSFPTL